MCEMPVWVSRDLSGPNLRHEICRSLKWHPHISAQRVSISTAPLEIPSSLSQPLSVLPLILFDNLNFSNTMDAAKQVLHDTFLLNDFRHHQEAIISKLLVEGQSALGIMPTGEFLD